MASPAKTTTANAPESYKIRNTHQIRELEAQADLQTVIKSLPRELFEKNMTKAYISLVSSVVCVALGYVSLALNPFPALFPLLWVFTGTALTGFFVLAHDAGHRSFSPRRWENDLVGHVLLLPLLYPFHCWRVMHDKHHKYTNHIEEDNAWAPLRPEFFKSLPPVTQFLYAQARGYFWWLASIGHWLAIHFDPKLYREQDRKDATFSMRVVQAFALVLFPTLFYFGSVSGGILGGFWTIINFWLMPFLVYHFWMSTFTLIHHTRFDVPFYEAQQWTAVTGQLFSTIHCEFPAWVEYLCHNINVHIPHHISTAIPSYNLPKAHKEIKSRWGAFIHETRFDWPLMKGIVRSCHLYNDEDGYYRAVQDLKD